MSQSRSATAGIFSKNNVLNRSTEGITGQSLFNTQSIDSIQEVSVNLLTSNDVTLVPKERGKPILYRGHSI